jgi:replication factor C subunit 3/5
MSNNNKKTFPWVEKYRPNIFEEIISHNHIISTIDKLINSSKLPHMIFYGPPGSGKTTTILACAREIYGSNINSMVLELNGSDDRGINVVREQIKDFAGSKQLFNKGVKLVILDEADSMTYDAQFALRRVIENYTYNTRFCLICNYITKIIPALQSRCTIFRFSPIKKKLILNKLNEVIKKENVKISENAKKAISKISEGDMRKAYNILQSVNMSFDFINEENVYECIGDPLPSDINNILNALINYDFNECYKFIKNIKNQNGLALIDIIKYITNRINDLQITKKQFIDLVKNLAIIECNLTSSTNEDIQLCSLIGSFIKIRYFN